MSRENETQSTHWESCWEAGPKHYDCLWHQYSLMQEEAAAMMKQRDAWRKAANYAAGALICWEDRELIENWEDALKMRRRQACKAAEQARELEGEYAEKRNSDTK